MKLLDRYILREYLASVTYCIAAFCMVFVVCDLFDHLSKFIEARTTATTIAWYYTCYLAQVMEHLLPASLLLATLYTLWRLARRNELTAMRANGVALLRIVTPFIAVGLFFSLSTAMLKERFVPQAGQWVARFMKNDYKEPKSVAHENVPYYNLAGRRQWVIARLDLKSPALLSGVKIVQERPDNSRMYEIHAREAQWLDGRWWLFDVEIQEYSEQGGPIGDRKPIPSSEHGKEMPDFTERPVDFVNELKNPIFFSASDILQYLRSHPAISEKELARKMSDYHTRLASPWACAIVVLFGIPAGAGGGRRSALVGIFGAVLLFVSFYALTQLGVVLGKTRIVWPWLGAWLSNIVFSVAGLVLLRRMR